MAIGTVAQIVKAVKAIDYQTDYRFDSIESVSFDTRKLSQNSLFIPLKGQTDGHDYIQQAIDQGAKAVFWGRQDQTPPEGICAIWVDDPLEAFQELAKWYLEKVQPNVIGITGSSGKTTTKDMTAAVLSSRYRIYKTQGNFNNDIGLPQTILDMPEDTEQLVLEMGMSDFGEIEFLSKLAKPSVAVITLIGESHMENLGSRAGIAKAKLEILKGLHEKGSIIFPANEPLLEQQLEEMQAEEHFKVLPFGEGTNSVIQADNIQLFEDYTIFDIVKPSKHSVQLPVLGAYNVNNALAALQVGLECDVPLEQAIEAIQQFELTKNRTQWVDGIRGSKILNDAYNASPIAMKSVIQSFTSVATKGRKIVVLGDIRELGEQSKALHASISEVMFPEKIQEVYLYGEEMSALYEALNSRFEVSHLHYVESDKAVLIQLLQEELQQNDQVLVKSSNGTGLLAVVEALKEA